MKAADRSGADFALVVGERELEQRCAELKNLRTGNQEQVPLPSVVEEIRLLVGEAGQQA